MIAKPLVTVILPLATPPEVTALVAVVGEDKPVNVDPASYVTPL